MSQLPAHDHDMNGPRCRTRVDPCATEPLGAELTVPRSDVPATTAVLEQLRFDNGLGSLSPIIVHELLRLDGYHARCRSFDAPETTWELPVSGLQDLQPT